uniref:Lipocalin 3 n=1 Tax=Rhipicephalus microplus TaxID=6941 RepID=A0A034WWN1_RHIMP
MNPSTAIMLLSLAPTVLLGEGQDLPERQPHFGVYQDESKCFPFQGTLYLIYRNFEEDKYVGGKAACVRGSQSGDAVDGAIPMLIEFGEDEKLESTFRLMSSPGYNVSNVINVTPKDNPNDAFNLTAAFCDCAQCKVLRHSYIDNGAGCSYWVKDQALNEPNTCCQFVYALLCGTKKYQVYEDGC